MESNQEMITVVSVDDHELLRRGIRFALLAIDDIQLVGEAADGEEALLVCAQNDPDVMLLDMHLPGKMSGPAVVATVRSNFPSTQVIVLSSFHDADLVQAAMQSGAIGYLVKGVTAELMANAIRAASEGRPTLSSEAVEALVQPTASDTVLRPGVELTERESEVLSGLVEGKSNADIANDLVLSVAAVKYHVSSILSKLGAANRTEAAMLAVENDLIQRG